MKLTGAAGDLVDSADRAPTAAAQHAAGLALVLANQNPEDAVARLRAAATSAPSDAKNWNDLAAAEYAAALSRGAASRYPVALADADHALRLDPQLVEALFNRALILEHLGLIAQARAAWQSYLDRDAGSKWAAEARAHLSRLQTPTGATQFTRELRRLETAAVAHDAAAVARIVGTYPQQARVLAEQQLLPQWGAATLRGDAGAADRALTTSRAIGEALAPRGETMLHDSVAAIDAADPAKRRVMADGHERFGRGREASKKQKPADAERAMREAATLLASAGDPMAMNARFYAASARLAQNDIAHARPELEALLSEAVTPELGAEVRWELARCHTLDDDWAAALPLLDEAHERYERLGERASAGFIDTMRAGVLVTLGRADEAWEARSRAFEGLSREGREDRLAASIDGAAQLELRAGRRDTALALLNLEESAQRTAANDSMLSAILVQKTLLSVALENHDAALRTATAAQTAAERVSDPGQRARAVADAQFATAAVLLERDPRRARELLTSAIGVYKSQDVPALLAEPFLLRARAALRLGDATAATADLDDGIAAVERKRIRFAGAAAGTGVLDAGSALFEDAVRLRLDRGDAAGAFAYAERARLADIAPDSPPTADVAHALEQRLAGGGVAVLELMALPREVVAFCITERGTAVARHPIVRETLSALDDDAKLYDALIRPSETSLAGARALVVVPDARLENVPFAALYDGRRHLVERMPVVIAASAASLTSERQAAPQTIAAIALPSGESSATVSLPESESELADVAHVYRRATIVPAGKATFAALASVADVVHVAGHTERQSGAGDAALVFAGRERVSWKTIASALRLHAKIVVLAACETLRRPNAPQSRTLSLGGAFLAAGARDVVGTLGPIGDADAHAIFLALHRELAAGVTPAEALRRAQLTSLSSRSAAWRNVTLLTSRLPNL